MGQRRAGGGALGLPAISDRPRVAVCLPPREGFGPGRCGAIGMIVRRLADADTLVIGGTPIDAPFAEAAYAAAPTSWFGLNRNTRYAAGAARLLRRHQPRLVEQYNRPLVALSLAARLRRTPVVLCLQNDPQAMRGLAGPPARRRLLARLAGAIVASEWLRARLLDGIADPPRPVHVLPNCLDFSELPAIAAPGARDQVLLFAGRLVADKGADAFVAACAIALPRLPGWVAHMIGADRFGPDSPDTPYLRLLRPAARAAEVTLLGYRAHPDVLAAMARAAVVAVPSRWQEPFGLAALEALACGAALVCSRRGGLPEVAGDAALYADPERPAALAEALIRLATDASARATQAAAGLARAGLFDAPTARARLADIRADILDRWSAAA